MELHEIKFSKMAVAERSSLKSDESLVKFMISITHGTGVGSLKISFEIKTT